MHCPGVKWKGLLTGEETGVIETYKFLAKLCLDWLLSFTKKSLVKFLRNVLKECPGALERAGEPRKPRMSTHQRYTRGFHGRRFELFTSYSQSRLHIYTNGISVSNSGDT